MKKYLSPELEVLVIDTDIMAVSNAGTGGIPSTGVLPYGTDDVTIFSDN